MAQRAKDRLGFRVGLAVLVAGAAPILGCGEDDGGLAQIPFLPPPQEVEEYTPTCSAALEREGDVTLRSGADVEAMAGVTVVAGDLLVTTSGPHNLGLGLDCLLHIGGSLRVENTADLERFNEGAFEKLETIGGDLIVIDNEDLSSPIPLFMLESVGGDIVVEDNVAFRSLGSVDLLAELGGGVTFRNNPAMNNIPLLSQITHVAGDLVVDGTQAEEIRIATQAIVDGNIELTRNSLATTAALGRPAEAGGAVMVIDNASLSSLTIGVGSPSPVAIAGPVHVEDNPVLLSLSGLSGVSEVEGDVVLANNALLPAAEVLANAWRVGGNLKLQDLGSLTSYDGFEKLLTVVGGLTVTGTALQNIQAPMLTSVAQVSIMDNTTLQSLDGLSALSSVSVGLAVKDNSLLPRCDAEELAERLVANGLSESAVDIEGNGDC